jgi:hypothetical protein
LIIHFAKKSGFVFLIPGGGDKGEGGGQKEKKKQKGR